MNDQGHQVSFTLPKERRLRKRAEISRVMDDGRASVGKCVVAKLLPNDLGHPRIGLLVSRKFGNAIKRNRMKRRMREAFRLHQHQLGSFDMVFLPRRGSRGAKEVSFVDFTADLLKQVSEAAAKFGEDE